MWLVVSKRSFLTYTAPPLNIASRATKKHYLGLKNRMILLEAKLSELTSSMTGKYGGALLS